MSDVWLSMEQAFENDISAMLPNTDDHLSEPGLIVSDLMDSNVTLNDIAHTIKSEPLDLDSNGQWYCIHWGYFLPLQLEIGIEGLFGVKWASGLFALYAIEPSGQLLCTFVPKWVKKIGWKAQVLGIGFNNSMVNRNLIKGCTTTMICENNISMSDGGHLVKAPCGHPGLQSFTIP